MQSLTCQSRSCKRANSQVCFVRKKGTYIEIKRSCEYLLHRSRTHAAIHLADASPACLVAPGRYLSPRASRLHYGEWWQRCYSFSLRSRSRKEHDYTRSAPFESHFSDRPCPVNHCLEQRYSL